MDGVDVVGKDSEVVPNGKVLSGKALHNKKRLNAKRAKAREQKRKLKCNKDEKANTAQNSETSEEVVYSCHSNRIIRPDTKCKKDEVIFWCGVCSCKLDNTLTTLQHFEGKLHKRNLLKRSKVDKAKAGANKYNIGVKQQRWKNNFSERSLMNNHERGVAGGLSRGVQRGRGMDGRTFGSGFSHCPSFALQQGNYTDVNQSGIPSASLGEMSSMVRRQLISALLDEEEQWVNRQSLNSCMTPPPPPPTSTSSKSGYHIGGAGYHPYDRHR